MPPRENKIIVITGSTASGKSELAVTLAKKINGEIISADSRQVYRGLDIGTGKVYGKWEFRKGIFMYRGIPHHCIDFVSPKKTFSAAEFQKCAKKAIHDILERGKTPILVGGTGFWIDAAVYDLDFPDVRPNLKLRKILERKTPEKLFQILKRLDPARAKTIDSKNPRRLVRAIEIAMVLGINTPLQKKSLYKTLWLGLKPTKNIWIAKVKKRVRAMIKNGITDEIKQLHKREVSKKRIKEFGFEYRLALAYLEKKISKMEFTQKLIQETLQYAKRQNTWFKRNKKTRWISSIKSAERSVKNFLQNS